MWETMHAQHTSQLKIIWDLKNLDFSLAPKETSEQHLEGTVHLHRLLGRWSSEFQDLVRYEKAYIRALNEWVNLNLIPIESNLNDEVSSPPCILQPAIQRLLQTWHNLLEKLPYKQAIDAIDSFRKAVHVIIRIIEEDELKMKRRCEETRRKYMRKSMRKYKKGAAASEEETATGADPENGEMTNRGDTRTERNGVLERLKMRLTDDEESYQRICKQVREKSVQSIRTHLVEFIRAMAEFALACSEMYRKLRSIATQSQNTMMDN